MSRVDRALVIELLADESLSYREISRQARCSDWSVRSIAQQLDAHAPPSIEHSEREPLTLTEWGIVAGIALLMFGGCCWIWLRLPPSQDEAM